MSKTLENIIINFLCAAEFFRHFPQCQEGQVIIITILLLLIGDQFYLSKIDHNFDVFAKNLDFVLKLLKIKFISLKIKETSYNF